jgi:ABC-type multidrug transport system fused ATPase/permease subunit
LYNRWSTLLFPFDILHAFANDVAARFIGETHWWLRFVVHIVVMYGPAALLLLLLFRVSQLWRRRIRRRNRRGTLLDAKVSLGSSSLIPGLFSYILRRTWRHQVGLVIVALLSMPVLYATLELPKTIINSALDSDEFPTMYAGVRLEQVEFLLALCLLFLLAVISHGIVKYVANLYQGRLSESVLRRLRLTVYREWRRRNRPGGGSQLIPVIVQELEPIGGFSGTAFVLPVLQGGTFLTILTFMFVQDPVLGAAAVTLLPVQLALIPHLQRRINALARERVKEVRRLGDIIGKEHDSVGAQNLRPVFHSLKTIQRIRYELFRRKFFMKGLNNFIGHMTPFFFYTIGGYLVIQGELSFGALVAVLTAYKDFSSPLKELFRYYQTMEDSRVRYEEVRRYLAGVAHSETAPHISSHKITVGPLKPAA